MTTAVVQPTQAALSALGPGTARRHLVSIAPTATTATTAATANVARIGGVALEEYAALAATDLLRGLDESCIQAVVAQARFARHAAKDVLPDAAGSTIVVLSGTLRAELFARTADQSLTWVAGPGQLLDAGVDETVQAVTDCWTVRLDTKRLRALAEQFPPLALRLLDITEAAKTHAREALTDLVFLDAAARLAKLMLRLERQYGQPVGQDLFVQHNLTQSDLAAILGSSRETINKALREFTKRGWARISVGSFVIQNRERLIQRSR
ncbi:Crp/Fnr family transcriptional regulator [Jatrophihabitans telluris]|uniref:Crp/Fnr family transcriptional regulator n=1 Tax=Jatrophihabitans telluris TaxID=2038343 RepID=A0ABY4R0Q3_9ACTN|nr:Crp/Fnr family transcriptional regulator [Jatrophihabitans telluris]UQX89047.1 Crp/Fnr family transcriptional regulator [Jatrophihabitans telluris]